MDNLIIRCGSTKDRTRTLQVAREIAGAMAYALGEIWSRPGIGVRCFIVEPG